MDKVYEARYGGGDDNDNSIQITVNQPVLVAERVETAHNKSFNPKKPRKQCKVESSDELIIVFIMCFERCGKPDFKLEKPLDVEKPIGCNCVARRTVNQWNKYGLTAIIL